MSSVHTLGRIAAVLLLPGLGLALAACERSESQAKTPPPPQVTVARPVTKTITDQDEYVGRFVAVDAVEVRARVSGYLEKVHFQDGQLVKKGDLLFTIDRRPFQNALDQARASLTQAKANLAFAESDLARAEGLVGGNVISRQTFEQRTQAMRVAEANVVAQEAAVRQAALDLEFTELRATASGRIGDRRVSPGNLVMGGTAGTTTLLATIQSIDPIRFEFTMDETSYLRYLRTAKGGPDPASRDANVPVQLRLLDERAFAHQGRMDFVDNAIDRSSGTIRGRAEFANADGTFTPGMFGRIQVASGPPGEALLVPDVAIGTEQVRKFVLVVDDQNIARAKYVTLGSVIEGLRVVASGLDANDRVVVNGLMRVRPGAKVTPLLSTAAASPKGAQAPSNDLAN
ncbi:MAG: efflux RND transporter periplasmic adaptor subunit [Hyphomonadaceae bacterium]|nr:efflux RND transporter periplasmic adaptor subunit [Hyphomonadaceae bacterium]